MSLTLDNLLKWAEKRYGYGCWQAPFWFLGPEEGMDKGGVGDTERKLKAWLELGEPEVTDCKKFHAKIKVTELHEPPPGPKLQPTWRPLMLFMMALFCRVNKNDEASLLARKGLNQLPQLEKLLRDYQRESWGIDHETCVIELSAFPAKGLAFPQIHKYLGEEQILEIRERRIKYLHSQIEAADNRPRLVMMYCLGFEKSWEKIAGGPFHQFKIQGKRTGIRKHDAVIYVLTPQPAGAFGMSNAYWVELAQKLRAEYPELLQK
jgi:hypothetical protein